MTEQETGTVDGAPPAPARPRWMAIARWLLVAVAISAFLSTLRRAELDRAAGLALAIGAPVLVVLLPWLFAMLLQTVALRRLLRVVWPPTGPRGERISSPRLLSVMLSSEAILVSLPGGAAVAESVSPYLLLRRCGVPLPEGLAAVAAKKSLIILANGLYIALAAAIGFPHMRAASRALVGSSGLEWIVLASAAGVIAGALAMSKALVSGSLASRSHGLLYRIPSARLRAFLDGRKHGFLETDRKFAVLFGSDKTALAWSTAVLLAVWLVEGTETWIILRLLHVDLSYAQVLSFEVVVSLLRSMAFMVPAGLGVQDAGYVAFLSAFGVPEAATVGVAFVLVKRTKEIFWVAVGFLMFVIMRDAPRPSPTIEQP